MHGNVTSIDIQMCILGINHYHSAMEKKKEIIITAKILMKHFINVIESKIISVLKMLNGDRNKHCSV